MSRPKGAIIADLRKEIDALHERIDQAELERDRAEASKRRLEWALDREQARSETDRIRTEQAKVARLQTLLDNARETPPPWQAKVDEIRRENVVLRRDLADLRDVLQRAIGHSNCYCDACKDILSVHFSPTKALERAKP